VFASRALSGSAGGINSDPEREEWEVEGCPDGRK